MSASQLIVHRDSVIRIVYSVYRYIILLYNYINIHDMEISSEPTRTLRILRVNMRRGTGTVPHKPNNGAVPCLGHVIDALFPQRARSSKPLDS